jgi:hypothetical protein
MFGAHARDEMDKAVKFVDRYAEFLTPANAEVSWFGKNMLLRYYRTKQLGPLEVCALALAVAPDAREGSAVLAAMVAPDAPVAYVVDAVRELWLKPKQNEMAAGTTAYAYPESNPAAGQRVHMAQGGTYTVIKPETMLEQYRFFSKLGRMPREEWPKTPEARMALRASTQSDLLGVVPGDVDGPTDDEITAASRKRGRAASELAPLLVPLSGACRPLALRRAHFARAEELALAVATLGSDPSASGVIRNQPGINRPRFETCTQTGYLGLPWPREEPSKLSELRKAIESAGLSTRGFAEKSEFRSAARRVDKFTVADWRVETEEGRRETLDEVFAMFRAGDFERFKEARRAEVWDALLQRDNQLGGVKFEGGRAEDLLVLAAAAELDVGLGWEDGAVLQAAKMRASEKLAADGRYWGKEMALVAAAHAHEKCVEALDRIPRATRLALLQWSLAPALRDVVRLRNTCCLADDGGLDFSGFARAHQLALRVFLCVAAVGRIDFEAEDTDEQLTAAASLLHYDREHVGGGDDHEVVELPGATSWPIDAWWSPTTPRHRMGAYVTPVGAEVLREDLPPALVLQLTMEIASVAGVAEIALTAIVLREVAEVAHPGDFWTRRLISGSTNGIENRPFPTFAERLDRLILERALDGFLVSKVATADGVLSMRFVWSGCPLNEMEPQPLEMPPGVPDDHKRRFVRDAARFFASNCAVTIREAREAGCADCPAVESVSIVYSGVGQLFRAVAPVATALFIDMMGEEAIQKAVLSEDPAFYRGLDELGICVFDMNADDDAATAGPDAAS